jgi:hypothetical protein
MTRFGTINSRKGRTQMDAKPSIKTGNHVNTILETVA